MDPERGSAPSQPALPSATTVGRREFITLSGLALSAVAGGTIPAMAGPFQASDFESLVPANKRLKPEWVRSLFERGAPTVYSKQRGELRSIGMPVGGFCCGTLYLGGDGKLWLWDIFNGNPAGIAPRAVVWNEPSWPKRTVTHPTDGANYVSPAPPDSPLQQGFALTVNGRVRSMDAAGWHEVTLTGEYPIASVQYSDPACPASVTLTAYSPFVPLSYSDSSLPVTILEYALTNETMRPLFLEFGGWLQNACSLLSGTAGTRVNSVHTSVAAVSVDMQFERPVIDAHAVARPNIVLDDFEHATYAPWRVTGTAFGNGPILRGDVPAYQGDVGGKGERVVNSHASAPGNSVAEKDSRTGMLTSQPFTIERRNIQFYVGGGANAAQVGVRLLVGGKTVRTAAGRNDNRMRLDAWDVSDLEGKSAVVQIYDNGTGGWGNIGVDELVQTDTASVLAPLESAPDWGTMALTLLGAGKGKATVQPQTLFSAAGHRSAHSPANQTLIGGITRSVTLAPNSTHTLTFLITWRFRNSGLNVSDAHTGNLYAARFTSAHAVAQHVTNEYPKLARLTKLWHATWRNSTLPHWLLDRSTISLSTLATSACHRFATGRFWSWEGVGCCEGTCTHVWHYAQAVGRLFPELERHHREFEDFGDAFDVHTGIIGYRGKGTGPAVDGQCGRILGAYREHTMSADNAFLKRIWPNVKLALEWLMRHDSDGDGLLDGAQENTLDAAWYGKIAWISSLYAAALLAGEAMARDIGDSAYANRCAAKAAQTRAAIETQLYNGEYFIQLPDAEHSQSLGTYGACHIDQVHGQSWAWQVGLGRVLNRQKTVNALRSLYRYNFSPDVGPYRKRYHEGRPYALAGDAGLIMATNPRNIPNVYGNSAAWQYGYFNECMTGFEHQVASHMVAEGLVLEGLAVTRAIHDRYHARRRNPFNEVECSDHYSRAMAAYGTYISVCGFECHGPSGHLAFAPRITPEKFKAAFTAPEGWGTFSQTKTHNGMVVTIELKYGTLRLQSLGLQGQFSRVAVVAAGKSVRATLSQEIGRVTVRLDMPVVLNAGEEIRVILVR